MALKFEYEFNMPDISVGPDVVNQSFITNEPSGALIDYCRNLTTAMEKEDVKTGAVDYNNLNFEKTTRRLAIAPVDKIGIKSFPHIGSYGFFKDKYTGITRVVVPINIGRELFAPPVLTLTPTATTWDFTIQDPSTVEYTCYRILLVNGPFAFEYITYDKEISCPIPAVKGTYLCYCIGYKNETSYCSDVSNIITKEVTEGKDNFGPDETLSYYTKDEINKMMGDIGSLLDKLNGVVI